MPTRNPAWPMIPSGGGLLAPPPPSPPGAAAAVAASSSRRRPSSPPSPPSPCPPSLPSLPSPLRWRRALRSTVDAAHWRESACGRGTRAMGVAVFCAYRRSRRRGPSKLNQTRPGVNREPAAVAGGGCLGLAPLRLPPRRCVGTPLPALDRASSCGSRARPR